MITLLNDAGIVNEVPRFDTSEIKVQFYPPIVSALKTILTYQYSECFPLLLQKSHSMETLSQSNDNSRGKRNFDPTRSTKKMVYIVA